MKGAGPFNVRPPQRPIPDYEAQARDELHAAQVNARRASQRREQDEWAAEHIRPLADWQRDALLRVLTALNEDD